MIAVNIVGLTLVAQQAFPLLKQTPRATVVNLCSASSIHGVPLLAVYRASKFTVNGLTESLNIEWAQHDIRVTAAKPPIVNTATGYQLNPRLTRKFGIDMSPQDVARVILRAVVGGRSGYVIGASARLRAWLDTCLPAALHRGLVRYLTGCSCRNPAITIPAI
jgi:short-subunit dehydrogenase